MMDIDLYTKDGSYVASTKILPFKELDGIVVQWGSRIFVYDKFDNKFKEGLLAQAMFTQANELN